MHDGLRKNKLYKFYCDECGIDRGYKPKNYKNPKCNRCAKNGTVLNADIKHKMSVAATIRYNDPNWAPKERIKVGYKNRKTRIYTTHNTPLQNKLKHNMRCLLSTKLRNKGLSKFRYKTFDLLGYTVDDLIKHLESRFQEGMTWDNYGKWEMDHVIPDSWFNYESMTDNDFKKSWSLENLQPMWASLNRSKGNRFSKEDLCRKR